MNCFVETWSSSLNFGESLGHKGNINTTVLVKFWFFWSLLFRNPNSFQYPIDLADKKRHVIAIHSFLLSPRFYAYVVDVLLCRMPPLQIAALKKRIQRPSYVPVDKDGNRLSDLTQHRTKTGAVSKSSGLCVDWIGQQKPLLSKDI